MLGTLRLCAIVLALTGFPAWAHDYNAGSLHIGHPWARATPKGATVGGAYLTVTNNGSTPDKLVAVTSPVAKQVSVHEMKAENGIMKMRPVQGGLEIDPGQTVTLKPGGYHLMLEDLSKPLKEGERVPATLEFAKAGKVNVELAIEGMGAMHEGQAGEDMSKMPGMAHQR